MSRFHLPVFVVLLLGDDIAEVVYFAAAVPEHIQVAEVLVMPTNQATGTIVSRK